MKKIDFKQIGAKVDSTTKGTIEKSKEAGKKAAVAVQKGTTDISDKMKSANYQSRLKKLNPLFPETYFSDAFKVPNIIKIVDDAERRGIDVCEGAIGWLGKANNVELMYLYDEAVEMSGLTFVPMAQCDAVYYVDGFDRKRFIRSDMIYSVAHEEQIAELKQIARKLGAKKCTIKIKEVEKEDAKAYKSVLTEAKKKVVASAKESAEISVESSSSSLKDGRIYAEFEGSSTPERPELKWFKHYQTIIDLIEGRVSGENKSNYETLELKGVKSSNLSQQAASAIDSAAGGMLIKGKASISKQVKQEVSKEMEFVVEF